MMMMSVLSARSGGAQSLSLIISVCLTLTVITLLSLATDLSRSQLVVVPGYRKHGSVNKLRIQRSGTAGRQRLFTHLYG